MTDFAIGDCRRDEYQDEHGCHGLQGRNEEVADVGYFPASGAALDSACGALAEALP